MGAFFKFSFLISIFLASCGAQEYHAPCQVDDEPVFLWSYYPVTIVLRSFQTDEQESIFYDAVDLFNENLGYDFFEISDDLESDVRVDFLQDFFIYPEIGRTSQNKFVDDDPVGVFLADDLDYYAGLENLAHELGHAIGMGHESNGLMYCYETGAKKSDAEWLNSFQKVREFFQIYYVEE